MTRWDMRVRNFNRTELPKGDTIKLETFDHVRIQKIALQIIGDDIDIRMMKGKRDMGVNTQFLDKYGIYNPNGDWYIVNRSVVTDTQGLTSNVVTELQNSPPPETLSELDGTSYYHVAFIPYEFEISDLELGLRNQDDSPSTLRDGRVVYMVPLEESD